MFAYCGNNPINCFDPSGAKLVILPFKGNNPFGILEKLYRDITLAVISRLTDDELICDYKTGEVSITQKSDLPDKEIGTNLIRSLCNDDNTIYVGIATGPVVGPSGEYLGSHTCPVGTCPDECDSIIILDLGQASMVNVGAEIILGHEMIHAYHNATNTTAWYNWYEEECHTVGLGPYAINYYNENALRTENGYPNRPKY